jgi:hypothetical protein
MTEIPVLQLERLKRGFPGVSPVLGAAHYEACLVCLHDQQHESGVALAVKGTFETIFQLQWEESVTEQMQRAWQDLPLATEIAACGLAFLLMEALTDYVILEKSVKTTGFDYWLTNKQNVSNPMEDFVLPKEARLEISGILQAKSQATVQARIRQKLNQTSVSDKTGFPAYIIVVEFSRPEVQVMKKWKTSNE